MKSDKYSPGGVGSQLLRRRKGKRGNRRGEGPLTVAGFVLTGSPTQNAQL